MQVATPCPQCGGEIEFPDETEVVKCRYCGSLLQLIGGEGVRRYYLKPKSDKETVTTVLTQGLSREKGIAVYSSGARLFFYPYWWVKGMVFKWLFGRRNIPSRTSEAPDGWENVKELKTHLLDYTFPGNEEIMIGPPHLGVRTQTMRVRAFNKKEMEQLGLPLRTTVSYTQAAVHAETLKGSALGFAGVSIEMERTRLIGERYALIFFPIWAISLSSAQGNFEVLLDGISHSVIRLQNSSAAPVSLEATQNSLDFGREDLMFIPFRCPVCGWDLPFHPYNVIHLCKSCGRAWWEKEGSYREVDYSVVQRKADTKGQVTYLPFWSFTVSLVSSGKVISTMDEFYRYFPAPRLADKDKERKRNIRFYVPAFRIKDIPLVNRFSMLFTGNQPERQYGEREVLLEHLSGNVFLRINDAKEMAEILLCSFVPPNSRKAKQFASQAQISFSHEELQWFPFVEKAHCLCEETTGYALHKNAVEI